MTIPVTSRRGAVRFSVKIGTIGVTIADELARLSYLLLTKAEDFGLQQQFPSIYEYATMIEMIGGLPAHTIGFKLSGKLHDEDYKTFVPLVDAELASGGKVNLLAQFQDFHGWDAHALWDDIKFATTHCNSINRIAIVGDKTWEKWMAMFCKPFTLAKVHYFDATEIEAAKAWLAEV